MLTTFATGSTGNAYEVYDGTTRLLLECGLPLSKLRKACGRALTDYDACLITHEHKDHSRAAIDIAKLGVPMYMTYGTACAIGSITCIIVMEREQFEIGTYSIVPFRAVHDAAEPVGFLIESMATGEKLVFATDTLLVTSKFKGLTEIAVECNYSEPLLEASFVNEIVKARTMRSHMSLERVLEMLDNTDLSNVTRIHLLHLSNRHSNAFLFRRLVAEHTGIPTSAG